MKSIVLKLILFSFILSGCTTNYYVLSTSDNIPFYSNLDASYNFVSIPSGSYLAVRKKKTKKKYNRVVYRGKKGYIKNNDFFVQSYKYRSNYGGNSTGSNNPNYTNGGGTVHVKGYYRKDGTYVRPHTRSSPRR